MKIQLALDRLSKEECFRLIEETEEYIDWIEIGTGVIKEYGMSIIREVKQRYPDTTLVADMKTCDAGAAEAAQAFEAGADISTVMAFSADNTISDTLSIAGKYGKRMMIDLLGVEDPDRVRRIEQLGADLVSLHYGKDMQHQGAMNVNLFDLLSVNSALEVAVAGGINADSLPALLHKSPSIVIVGSAITKAPDSKRAAEELKGVIESDENHH
ncbi:iron-sulfur cluster assembly protein HesB [Jeotgalibacillus malaysiensis]|uniref:3-hexulose-6-phosphate synthase n=1 Tax=Jeotgalibacillus malaysiensis TaxID=1508404 RepID=A0A0B5AW29_9BACL|nr:3-hexulose-6-phosphate synthase [Jeotgalibacillus malaysiensis]AJD92234.1 iron-sulfur cluster assembly protein HesB [Jeotgalibacillus malaysiensis]